MESRGKRFPKSKVIESVQFGDTLDGDVLIFHPENNRELVVLPRNDDMLYIVGTSLYEAIDWLCVYRGSSTGGVGETHEKRYFVPYNPLQWDHGVLFPENI